MEGGRHAELFLPILVVNLHGVHIRLARHQQRRRWHHQAPALVHCEPSVLSPGRTVLHNTVALPNQFVALQHLSLLGERQGEALRAGLPVQVVVVACPGRRGKSLVFVTSVTSVQ